MSETIYLSEEQYNEILSPNEISRIKDYELRGIRSKYWNLRHEAFLDEHNIPDQELEKVWNSLKAKKLKSIGFAQSRGVWFCRLIWIL